MTDPTLPDACAQAAVDKATGGGVLAYGMDPYKVTRSALAAALSVRDDQGVPELLKPWLEAVGWWNEDRGLHPLQVRPEHGVHEYECYVTDLAVFRLRGATENE